MNEEVVVVVVYAASLTDVAPLRVPVSRRKAVMVVVVVGRVLARL